MSAQPMLVPKHLLTDTSSDCASVAGDYSICFATGDGATAASAGDGSGSTADGDSVKAASAGHLTRAISRGYSARSASAGDSSVALATGDYSCAAVAGDTGSALVDGEGSIAMAAGVDCTVQAGDNGCFAACYYAPGNTLRILVGYVGENGILADTAYRIAVDLDGSAHWVEA